jgi:hypothetical protein
MKIKIANIGAPAGPRGDVFARDAIAPKSVPVFADFDYSESIGLAHVHADGAADLELAPGVEIDVERLEADQTIGVGFRVLEQHDEPDGLRVIDRLEVFAVGVSRNLIRRSGSCG